MAKEYIFKLRFAFLIGAFLFMSASSHGQEKIKPKLRLSYTKYMSGRVEIRAKANYKGENQVEPCAGATIGFYKDENLEELYQKMPADESGQAVLSIKQEELKAFEDSANHYHFYARLEEDSKYQSREADLVVLNANIEMNFEDKDSIKFLMASLTTCDENSCIMVPGVKLALKCFVKRSLCLLPFGDNLDYSDSTGNVQIKFPKDIVGDDKGNLSVIIKIDEDERYGTVQYEGVVNWGKPMHSENPVGERSLIGARNNAPWFMVIGVNAILFSIWGFLLYVVIGLIRIKRLGAKV